MACITYSYIFDAITILSTFRAERIECTRSAAIAMVAAKGCISDEISVQRLVVASSYLRCASFAYLEKDLD